MPIDIETPAFVVDGDAIFARALALSSSGDRCRFSYSVKTLPVPEAVVLAREAGWLVEVVSSDEYAFVCRLGISPEEIVLNGPSKDDNLLHAAFSGGAIVHVDSEEELRRAVKIRSAVGNGRLGVRLGLGVADTRWARFGIDVSDTDASIRLLAEACSGQSLNGFHVHSGANRASVQEFIAVSGKAIDFARAYSRYVNTKLDWIDLGGGFGDSVVAPEGAVNWNPPEVEDCSRAASALIGDWNDPGPLLLFEPGRALVGPCVDLYTRVETVKSVAGVQVVTLDAGINTLLFARTLVYPVDLCDDLGGTPVQTVLCGPLCMADDILRRDIMLPPLKKGALLRIRGVGAYNVSMSFDFIRPRADVLIVQDGKFVRTRTMFVS